MLISLKKNNNNKKKPLKSHWHQTFEQNYYIHWITKNKHCNVVICYKNIVAFQI